MIAPTHHLRLAAFVGLMAMVPGAVAQGAEPAGPAPVVIREGRFTCDGRVVRLKGTNYYPRRHMWAALWDRWNPAEVRAEAEMVRGLGLNCVRILVPYTHGGWSGPKPPADRLKMLAEVVNLFGERGIRSCVTLFDWETTYPAAGDAREADHQRYLEAVVGSLRDSPFVLMWDVKNEPDHPSALRGRDDWSECPEERGRIVSWLGRMCAAVRRADPDTPVTVGLRWAANFDEVVEFVDVAVFHSYWPNIGTEQIPFVKRAMGARRLPIVVQEFGWPTHPTPCDREGRRMTDYTEADQLAFYRKHLEAFAEHDIAGCLQWMTFDAKAYGDDPKESFEQYFGLWRFDGSLKPAGALYRDLFAVRPFPGGAPASTRPAG